MNGDVHRIDLTGPQATWPLAARGLWRDATEHVLTLADSWHPPPPQGDPRLRDVLGSILRSDPDDILITNGVRAGASVIARGTNRVVHERPSFAGTVAVLQSYHPDLALRSWADLSSVDSTGVVWLTSPCRNPDGAALTAADRTWVDALARFNQLVVNEVYRWFGPVVDLPDPAWLTGSLSKLAGSGAGLGWIRGPGAARLAERQHARPSLVWQRCWCYLLERGAIEMFVDHTVRPAAAAAEAFADELYRVSGLDHRPARGAAPPFFLLPAPTATAGEFVDRLAATGIGVGSGDHFLATVPSIRVCFVGVSVTDAREAARVIGAQMSISRRDAGRRADAARR